MDAKPFLVAIAEALDEVSLEAILVGNAAAALHGAPVTTLDFDFMFRKTAANLGKLKKLAQRLNAVILCPFYPVSELYRVVVEDTGLQLDFMSVLHGIRSFASLRSRAERMTFSGASLWLAALGDVFVGERTLGRGRSKAIEAQECNASVPLAVVAGVPPAAAAARCRRSSRQDGGVTKKGTGDPGMAPLGRVKDASGRAKRLERLKAETEKAELEQIRRLLALPPEKRTHFLRRRTGFVGSAL